MAQLANGLIETVDAKHGGPKIGFFTASAAPVAQAAHVTDASTAHALAVIFNDTEVESALNALGTKINDLLAILEDLGLVADA